MSGLSHIDERGQALMVDVTAKPDTERIAIATGVISMSKEAFLAVEQGSVPKGDVLAAARIAGIMAAKKTSELIPLCHPLLISSVKVEFTLCPETHQIRCNSRVKLSGKTGVEMEALCAVSTALLTIYDMVKAMDKSMVISGICLLEKEGGKSGLYQRQDHEKE